MTDQSQLLSLSHDSTDGLHAETLTSRRAMAAVAPAAAEVADAVAGCGEVEGDKVKNLKI